MIYAQLKKTLIKYEVCDVQKLVGLILLLIAEFPLTSTDEELGQHWAHLKNHSIQDELWSMQVYFLMS